MEVVGSIPLLLKHFNDVAWDDVKYQKNEFQHMAATINARIFLS
jgi:hypothetical protein